MKIKFINSRGIIEYYHLKPDSLNWTTVGINKGAEKVKNEENTSADSDNFVFRKPVQIDEKITWLKRRSPYPTYERIPFRKLEQVTEMKQIGHVGEDEMISLVELVKPDWKYLLPEENKFLEELQKESDTLFRGKYKRVESLSGVGRSCEVGWHGNNEDVFTQVRNIDRVRIVVE